MHSITRSNLTKEMFPDPTKRGLLIMPVCPDIEIYIWNLLLTHISGNKRLQLSRQMTIGFQNRQQTRNRLFELTNSLNQGITIKGDTPGVVTYNFPQLDKTYIMRGLLGHNPRLNKEKMIYSVTKRNIQTGIQKEIISKIEKDDHFWFINVFITMLSNVGIKLSNKEKKQIIVNIEWFYKNYYSEI